MDQERAREKPLPRAQRRRVMLVDDDDELRAALAFRLAAHCGDVVTYADAQEALEALRGGLHPDLIVLDLMMPGMDGWQFRVAQKSEPRLADIPVIVLSADGSAQAAAIDADAHLRKPIDGELLEQTVEEVATRAAARRAERTRVEELQRLVSLGALLGGIAHEINNPLALVFGNLDILQRQLVGLVNPKRAAGPFSVAVAMRALERARDGAERVAAVVRSASIFASADLAGEETLDVHALLESAIQVASSEIRHGANLVRSYRDAPRVYGNPARLGQVFLNLLLNAVYAIHDEGGSNHVIRVSTECERECVIITVADSATCLDAEGTESMFDATSAAYARGPRLRFGLAVSRELVQEMGGSIEYLPSQPRGASFRVTLPACERVSLPAPPPKPPTRLRSERPTVLVVDDEALLCELLSAMLADRYEVSAFSSPRAALAALLEHDYDAVVCDVMMPTMTGMELFDAVVREHPRLAERFLFITGGAFTERARLFLKQTGRPVLRKPCARAELLEVIERIATREVDSQRE
jgi:CheY-like chemotaxis protein/nitrogen-specific signal transduction histidine kinase